jgi:hypothetical protein
MIKYPENYALGQQKTKSFPKVQQEKIVEIIDALNQLETDITDVKPYKVYTAIISQSGTNAPTTTVFENTLGGAIIWTYDGVGSYTGTLNGAFTNNKTVFFISPDTSNVSALNNSLGVVSIGRNDADSIYLSTGKILANGSRDVSNNVLFHGLEIRVYN